MLSRVAAHALAERAKNASGTVRVAVLSVTRQLRLFLQVGDGAAEILLEAMQKADIPEEWLKKLAEKYLTEEEKKALEKEFLSFYAQMKEAMRGKSELRNLDVPLEKIKESVKAVAHGVFFGAPMVTVEEKKDWGD